MVCKEEICAWFKKVPGSCRIDVICALMQLSHPLERRYIGAVLESLCQVDYRCLVPEETKANNPDELRKIAPNLHDACNRSKLSVYLSLLHSSNSVCSQLIYELLSSARTYVEKKNTQEGFSKTVVDEILLLLTLAVNHPAFSFQQRLELFDFLQALKQDSKSSAEHSPGEIADNGLNLESCSESSYSPHSRASPYREGSASPVHVKSLDLTKKSREAAEKSQKPNDRNTEFEVHVVWTNGKENVIIKTYQEIFSFHAELIKLFPKDAGAHKQERHIPFLPQVKTHSDQNLHEPMRKYIRLLGALPDRILQCQLFYQFFNQPPHQPNSSYQAPSPPPRPPAESPARPKFGLWSQNGTNGDSDSASVSSTEPTHIESMCYHNSSHVAEQTEFNQPNPVNGPGVAVSVLSSPPPPPSQTPPTYMSPRPVFDQAVQSSPGGSPSHRPIVGEMAPQPDNFMSVQEWLLQARLHKYAEKLADYSFEELLNLTVDQLDDIGLTAGAKKKFFQEVQNLRAYLKQCNGVQQPPFSYPPPLPAECYIYPTIQAPLPPNIAPPLHPTAPPPALPPQSGDGMTAEMGTSTPVSSLTSEEEISVPMISSNDSPAHLPDAAFPVMPAVSETDLRPTLKVDKATNPKGHLSSRREGKMGIDEGAVVPVVTVPTERRSPLVNPSYVNYMQANLPRQPLPPRFPPGMLYAPGGTNVLYPMSPRGGGQHPMSRPSSLEVGWNGQQQIPQGMVDSSGFERPGNQVTYTIANTGMYCVASAASNGASVMSQANMGATATAQGLGQQGVQTPTVITTVTPNGGNNGGNGGGITSGNGNNTQPPTPQAEGNASMLICNESGQSQCSGNHNFQYIAPNPPPMFPAQAFVPSPSNGLISPGFAISAPPPQGHGGLGHSFSHPQIGSNGINPALLPPNMQPLDFYPHQPRTAVAGLPQGTVMLHLPFIPQFSYYYSQSSHTKRKPLTCYNCGQVGHVAKECSSPPMDVHNASASYYMDYKPKDVKSS